MPSSELGEDESEAYLWLADRDVGDVVGNEVVIWSRRF